MGIYVRLKNAMSYGGVKEVIRKAFFLGLYKITGGVTAYKVKRKKPEYGLSKEDRDVPIIVSLTSFPPRFPYIDLCLKSLLLQETKPDKIIVYLGSDSTPDMLTKQMLDYQEYGIEYRFDKDENLMPHKKYFYAMQEYPDAAVVTADDDVIYPANWLTLLYRSFQKYPNAISARRVHLMKFKNGKLLPYDSWKDQCRDITEPSMLLIGTGNAGILYPPGCFDSESFNISNIKKLCLRTDDIWLKCMEIRNRIPVVWVRNWQVCPASIDNKDNQRLQDENIFSGKNDTIMYSIFDEYSINESDILEPVS